jgi:hypothetical protein
MRQIAVAAGIFLLTLAPLKAGEGKPSVDTVTLLTDALIAGDVAVAHGMTTSFLGRKVSLYAFQGMMETGGIFAVPGRFEFTETLEEGAEVSMVGQFHPADGSDPRPVRFSWLEEDGEWRLNRFGF